MRAIINPILNHVKKIRYLSVYKHIAQNHLIGNVPYYSQWESPELVSSILSENIRPEDDTRWRESGAINKEEYALWSNNGCGMACTKMILAYKTEKVYPLVDLGKKCAEYGGYKILTNTIDGLFYKPYVNFLKFEYRLNAKVVSYLTTSEMLKELHDGNFVIASVNYDIRNPKVTPIRKGGHLVLVLGYDLYKKVLYFHNPSGTTLENQQYAEVSFADFDKFFANRGIVINSN